MILAGKNVVIYGAGISGLSAYGLVTEKGGRAIIYDDAVGSPHATSNPSVFRNADVIVLSPGVSNCKDFLLDAKLENKIVISELELASNFCLAEQIAVTGTNGKTTTTMLIDHIFKHAHKFSHAVGNIGVAFSGIADKLDSLEIAVIEASSFQLESALNFSPDTAVLLNITPDHLERHVTIEKYIAAKANIFLHQTTCDSVIFNVDDKYISALEPLMVAKKIPFSLTRPVDGAYVSSDFLCYKGMPIIEISEVSLRGRELENALAAIAVTASRGIQAFTIASALATFIRPEFRRNNIATIDGISIFNDSKATNVYATLSAVEGMEGDTVLLLGGAKRNEDFVELFEQLDKEKVKAIIAIGENSRSICSAAATCGYSAIIQADDLLTGVSEGLHMAQTLGCKNLLFSPSSKSFDNYSSYIERGKAFCAVVDKIKEQ